MTRMVDRGNSRMKNRTMTDLPPIIRSGRFADFDPESIGPEGALLLVDKPLEWTSFDVVAKVRRATGIRKIGHAGTLDPLATGLLVVCIGRATKRADEFQAGEKEYTGRFHLGATTPTDDAEGEPEGVVPVDHLTPEEIDRAAESFLGESLQIPPMFSARKVGGKRLYKLARKGIEVERPARPVTIRSFEITSIDLPSVSFRIVCSRGTYIRSIARNLGERLGVGAYLAELRRIRSGEFSVDDAVTIEELTTRQ